YAGATPSPILVHREIPPEQERLLRVHTLARGSTPVVRLPEAAVGTAPAPPAFQDYPATAIICGRTGGCHAAAGRPLIHVTAERLAPPARVEVWRPHFPELSDQAPQLAARYPIEPATAAEIASDLALRSRLEGCAIEASHIGPAIRARSGMSLAAGVTLIH